MSNSDTELFTVKRGDEFTLAFEFTFEDHDWQDTVVEAQVRGSSGDDAVLAIPTVIYGVSVDGTLLQGTIRLTPEQTAGLPDWVQLGVRALRATPAWGPHSLDPIQIQVLNPSFR